jgi:hypothetical protein
MRWRDGRASILVVHGAGTMMIDKLGKIAYKTRMHKSQSLLSQRLALEVRYDGLIPPQERLESAGTPVLRPVVAAMARRRRIVSAAAAARDPALTRISRYLTEAVVALRI